jgi:hypothetical protein
MKAIILFLICTGLFACNMPQAAAPETKEVNEFGTVYYVGFEIELITGIPESQIEEYGYLYKIEKKSFHSILTQLKDGADQKYNAFDVRAKVIFSDECYFIDRAGVAKSNGVYAMIDKKKFVQFLILVEDCKPGEKERKKPNRGQ